MQKKGGSKKKKAKGSDDDSDDEKPKKKKKAAGGRFFWTNQPVLRIRIHRIHVFFDLLDPDPDPLVRVTDPDPCITKQK